MARDVYRGRVNDHRVRARVDGARNRIGHLGGGASKPGAIVYCQPDGRYDNSVLCGEGVQRKRTSRMAWVQTGPWGAVTNPASGRTIIGVTPTRQATVELSDWGQDGGHLTCQSIRISPNAQERLVFYLALADLLQEAKRYAALAE